jgi:hypothetical protein
MQSQRVLIVVSGVIVCLAVGFVVYRWRHPPPPPPEAAVALAPGKSLGPFTLGMSRAEAEAKLKTMPHAPGDASVIVEGGVAARLRDGKVVGASAELGTAGIALEGAWIPLGIHAKYTGKAIAEAMRNCTERKSEIAAAAGVKGSRFDCGATQIEVDETHDRVTVTIGAF